MPGATRKPVEIRWQKRSRVLQVSFDDGKCFAFPAEYLRVYSPSAEVSGHGRGQEVLQVGKKDVSIDKIEPIGNYAVRLIFDDGHDTGLYSWKVLYELGEGQMDNWASYLARLAAAGKTREAAS